LQFAAVCPATLWTTVQRSHIDKTTSIKPVEIKPINLEFSLDATNETRFSVKSFLAQQKAKKSSFFTANNKKQEWKRKCKHW
jgi:hypothetical protein